ncbi:MAG: D-aminopeptidase [Acetobacteraceae bacterium]|nr:D-aminopeptidase [Acetobacteraceae bacterium]
MPESLDQALAALPLSFPGAGGAVAVVKDGQILARHAWGFADLERRIPFTPATMFLVCSITKQFTCATTLLTTNLDRAPDILESQLAVRLPRLARRPTATHLAHNQSGLRDYWALTALSGSPVEAPFTEAQARRLTDRAETTHFTPGTRYSYCNQNFRILGDLISERAGRPLAELMRSHVFDRAGMPTARLNPDTSQVPGFTRGYEGSQQAGFRPAENRITWTGDAGLSASLDDLIAWERHIDATRDNPESIHARLSAPVAFADGSPAGYGWGLARGTLLGRDILSHGGGLRGWRSFRAYAPAARLSVVVLFNHMADPRAAATRLVAAALGEDLPTPATGPQIPWAGRYLDPETGLAAHIEAQPNGHATLHFAGHPEPTTPAADGSHEAGPLRLRPAPGGLRMTRATDNIDTVLEPATGTPAPAPAPAPDGDGAGRYRNEELGADITIADAGGTLYAACAGELGEGAMVPLVPYAADTWLMPCPRALDFSAPGDWTLTFRRSESRVTGLQLGCWLARGIEYTRA